MRSTSAVCTIAPRASWVRAALPETSTTPCTPLNAGSRRMAASTSSFVPFCTARRASTEIVKPLRPASAFDA